MGLLNFLLGRKTISFELSEFQLKNEKEWTTVQIAEFGGVIVSIIPDKVLGWNKPKISHPDEGWEVVTSTYDRVGFTKADQKWTVVVRRI